MQINIRYIKENDLFEIQAIDKKVRSHFLLSRAELNNFRTILEKALLESKTRGKNKNEDKPKS